MRPMASPPGPPAAAHVIQRQGTGAAMRATPGSRAQAFRLEPAAGGRFRLADEGGPAGMPDGTYNFVRVQGGRPREAPWHVSSQLPHARLAGGRPVLYAGTAAFAQGRMEWWSNYSGTYQPVAAFRAKAGLPEDRFVPWQKLQLGGHAQQRSTFADRRPAAVPQAPERAGGATVEPAQPPNRSPKSSSSGSAGG